jgi:hypothetical protein
MKPSQYMKKADFYYSLSGRGTSQSFSRERGDADYSSKEAFGTAGKGYPAGQRNTDTCPAGENAKKTTVLNVN